MIGCDCLPRLTGTTPAPDGLPLASRLVLNFNPPLGDAAACEIFERCFRLISMYQNLTAGLFTWERRNW